MKGISIFVGVVFAAAGLVAAQTSNATALAEALKSLPSCSVTCISDATTKSGCNLTDIKCQCTTGAPKYADALGPCLCKSTCKAADYQGIIDFSVKICSSVIDNYVAQTAGLNPAQCTATSSGTLSASTASGGIVVASGSAPVTTGTAMHNGTTAATASPTGTGAATNGSSSANSSAATTTPSPSGSNAGSRIAGDIGLAGAIGLALMAL